MILIMENRKMWWFILCFLRKIILLHVTTKYFPIIRYHCDCMREAHGKSLADGS